VALAPGTRLGAYEILTLIGSGGMGEVYRATDTKLHRDVAIKVLPADVAADADRLARFEREAQVLASLNHPNIAHIHGIEDSTGVPALVMELVEGPILADRIAKGPIPLDEALPIAKQIAEALEAAHEQGIIHRDLKPANVKVRPDGTVKVLDFGLAKAFDPAAATAANATLSPTLSVHVTQAGMILGSAAYMSPEQARGKPVDKRADIWAFGCVMFEMVTGTRPFDAGDTTSVLARIIEREPDWRALPPGTPGGLRSFMARCLRKDPAQRLHDIADVRILLDDVSNDRENATTVIAPTRKYREWAAWTAAAVFLGAALFIATRSSTMPSSNEAISFPVFPPEGNTFATSLNTTLSVPSFALSPDGHSLVFAAQARGARPQLWLRSLDQVSARPLTGTEDALSPMWSPDSRWIAFFSDGNLKKVPAAGGAVQVITQTTTDVRGGTWCPDGTILFGSGTDPILRVNAAGGAPTPVTVIDAPTEEQHRYPSMLIDGRHFLYTVLSQRPDQTGVYVGSLDGRTKKRLVHATASGVYVQPGYLLLVDGDTLLGQVFDTERLELKGQPLLVAEQAGRDSAYLSAVSTSRTGIVAYASPVFASGRLTWIDRRGKTLDSTSVPEGDYTDFRLAPDGTRLVASRVDPKTNSVEIWLTDLARGSTSRVATGGLVNASVVWSPDSTQLVFRSSRSGAIEFFQRSAGGGGADHLLVSHRDLASQIPSLNLLPTDWSPDGRNIVFSAPTRETRNDLWLLPLGGGQKPTKFIASPADEMHGNFSPDGHLVAYTSNESGKFEVYVETVPRSDRKWPVSTNGGYEPRWRADGREVYYLSDDRKLMVVAVGAGPSFGIPQPLFQTRVPEGVAANRTHYVPDKDGQRFLVNAAGDAPISPITVVLNWTALLKK
jgi:serine/threonine protein kinase